MGCGYYGLNAWLPDAYIERGWSEASAGALLAAMNLTAIPSSFGSPWLSERYGGRQRWMQVQSIIFLAATIGVVTAPSFAYAWCLLAGISQGGLFSLVMTVPLDLEDRPERVGGLVAMMLGFGYTIAATSPFVLGAVRDATGSFDGPLGSQPAASARSWCGSLCSGGRVSASDRPPRRTPRPSGRPRSAGRSSAARP